MKIKKVELNLYTYSEQKGTKGHCELAQIFSPSGKSFMDFDFNENVSELHENVKLITNELNRKLFRDIHNIEIEISYNFAPSEKEQLGYGVSIMSNKSVLEKLKWHALYITGIWYKSYEQALEEGIKEAIKIIR